MPSGECAYIRRIWGISNVHEHSRAHQRHREPEPRAVLFEPAVGDSTMHDLHGWPQPKQLELQVHMSRSVVGAEGRSDPFLRPFIRCRQSVRIHCRLPSGPSSIHSTAPLEQSRLQSRTSPLRAKRSASSVSCGFFLQPNCTERCIGAKRSADASECQCGCNAIDSCTPTCRIGPSSSLPAERRRMLRAKASPAPIAAHPNARSMCTLR
jgi:hypothetical protein